MKKSIKNSKSLINWRFVVAIMVICASLIIISVAAKLWERFRNTEWLTNVSSWETSQLRIHNEVTVSDNGKWYLIPDVKLKFPFFATMENAHQFTVNTPLRYTVGYYIPGDVATGFRVKLTYDLLDKSTMGAYDWPEGCIHPFVFDYNYGGTDEAIHDQEDATYGYKIISTVSLADRRTINLKKRTAGEQCIEFTESDQGQFIINQLKKVESY
jgi:hypothetical protein